MSSEKSDSNDFKTILFFSVDIVGSTKYKQEVDPGNWVANFKTFYEKFPVFLREIVEATQIEVDEKFLWKSLGDELIFRIPVKTLEEIASLVGCFQDTIKAYKKKKHYIEPPSKSDYKSYDVDKLSDLSTIIDLGLDLKGSCFTIVTPYPDVCLDEEQVAGLFQGEYIGPGVDTGFRVFHKAEADSFTVSVEVAYAIAKTKTRKFGQKVKELKERLDSLKSQLKNITLKKKNLIEKIKRANSKQESSSLEVEQFNKELEELVQEKQQHNKEIELVEHSVKKLEKEVDVKLYSVSGLMFLEYISLKGVWGELDYPLFALRDKKTEDVQDALDKEFKRTVNHDLDFKGVADLLEKVLLAPFPPAFLCVKGEDEEEKLLEAVHNARAWYKQEHAG